MPPPCPHQEPQPIDFTPCEECRNQVRDPKEHSRLHANGKYCVHSQPVQENDHISQVTKLVEPSGETWEESKKLGMECPHGNFVGWCDNCPKEYLNYVKSFIHKVEKDTEARVLREILDLNKGIRRLISPSEIHDYAKSKGLDI